MALPSGYKQVEYIESSGTQYINTGVTGNQNTRVIIDFYPTEIQSNGNFLFGSRTTYSSQAFDINVARKELFINFATTYQYVNVSSSYARFVVDMNKNNTTVTNSQSGNTYSATFASSSFTTPSSLYIGTAYNNGHVISGINDTSGESAFVGRIYSCKLYSNGTLVRDLVPCINPNNMIGMYDNVNGVFYSNAGSGVFVAGAVIDTFALSSRENVGGVLKAHIDAYENVGGVLKKIVRGYQNVGGVLVSLDD